MQKHESNEAKERHIEQEYVAEIFKEKNEKYLRVGEMVKEIAERRTSKRMGEFIVEERKRERP